MAVKAWVRVGVAAFFLVATPTAQSGQDAATWQVDAINSNITFSLTHFMVSKAHGRFAKFTANLNLDPSTLTASKVDVRIDAASIDTSNSARDDHLRTADFFDVQRFPEIVFTSTRIERSGDNRLR